MKVSSSFRIRAVVAFLLVGVFTAGAFAQTSSVKQLTASLFPEFRWRSVGHQARQVASGPL
jgi:hypothetical protein